MQCIQQYSAFEKDCLSVVSFSFRNSISYEENKFLFSHFFKFGEGCVKWHIFRQLIAEIVAFMMTFSAIKL